MVEGLRGWWIAPAAALALFGSVSGQDLADYDYENLSLRGIGVEAGVIFPNRLESAVSLHLRFDLGDLGPGFRLSPTLSYWRSDFKASEVTELEDRLEQLIVQNEPGASPTVDLGVLRWSDLILGLDGQYVWRSGSDFEAFIGTGVGTHVMNGEGPAIEGTFVEDLLDRVTIGVNGHAGLAFTVAPGLRVGGQLRYEVLDDLSYPEIRIGGVYSVGGGPQG